MNCTDNHIDINTHLNGMLRKSGDLVGLPITEVTGHTENAINCDRQHLTFMDLIKLSIGVDGCGKPALRVKKIDTCTLNATCDNAVVNDNLNKIFAYDSTEKTFAIVLNETA